MLYKHPFEESLSKGKQPTQSNAVKVYHSAKTDDSQKSPNESQKAPKHVEMTFVDDDVKMSIEDKQLQKRRIAARPSNFGDSE